MNQRKTKGDRKDKDLTNLDSSNEINTIKRFRLLIIGRSGCGKTTILSKVCGEEVADKPSTTRGMHNIEREMEFQDNKLFLVHDSEGFEAGQENEFQVVVNFIRTRSRMQNINDRLHAIWYCLTTSSRPIQQSEEMFFSVKHEVPIVAVFTKFDLFVEDQLQDLMENAEDPDDVDEEALEQQAAKMTAEKFEKHYKSVLLEKPFPPQAVVAVSNIHTSTPMDGRFRELLNATSEALDTKTDKSDIQRKLELRSLFASAQMADLELKYHASIDLGLELSLKPDHNNIRYQRLRLINVWNTVWTSNPNAILTPFQSHVEKLPQVLYDESALELTQTIVFNSIQRALCRAVQLFSDLTVVMAEIFLLQVKLELDVKKIVEDYPNTPAFTFVQKSVLEVDWELLTKKKRIQSSSSIDIRNTHIVRIIAKAVKLNARAVRKS